MNHEQRVDSVGGSIYSRVCVSQVIGACVPYVTKRGTMSATLGLRMRDLWLQFNAIVSGIKPTQSNLSQEMTVFHSQIMNLHSVVSSLRVPQVNALRW